MTTNHNLSLFNFPTLPADKHESFVSEVAGLLKARWSNIKVRDWAVHPDTYGHYFTTDEALAAVNQVLAAENAEVRAENKRMEAELRATLKQDPIFRNLLGRTGTRLVTSR